MCRCSELAEKVRAELQIYVKAKTDEILNLNNTSEGAGAWHYMHGAWHYMVHKHTDLWASAVHGNVCRRRERHYTSMQLCRADCMIFGWAPYPVDPMPSLPGI